MCFRFRPLLVLLLLFYTAEAKLSAQQTLIRGIVKDTSGIVLGNAAVIERELSAGTYTSADGTFELRLPRDGRNHTLIISSIGYLTATTVVKCDKPEINLQVNLKQEIFRIGEIPVTGERTLPVTMVSVPITDFRLLPSASGGFEAMLKTMPGVSSNNELSSQYSVRGGNYDENLVYVNDIEIYRPFLVRSGQQEGLSFINPDLISGVSFSAGGFNASFGDKLSSVLDVTYRKPDKRAGSVSLGLMTSSAHLEGRSNDERFTWLMGGRYKTTKLLLNTLDSRGDYKPVFADIQSVLTYATGKRSHLSLMASYSSNTYNFIPESRTSTFGTATEAYRLFVMFEGMEKDNYDTWNASLSWETKSISGVSHKINLSAFGSGEEESFDIRGTYSLSNLDQTTGSENSTDSLMAIGLGGFLSHARNRLSSTIASIGYRGNAVKGNSSVGWGVKMRNDWISDRIREWKMVDSAGYSIPYSREELRVSNLISSRNILDNQTIEGFIESKQTTYTGPGPINLSAGIRGFYFSFTDEILLSPRISVSLKQGKRSSYWLSSGLYYQPPFYREMRYPDGTINPSVKSQKSIHIIAGMSYDFKWWERPFRLSGEVYNKILSNIIPYRVDNVRIIYSGENSAKGYSRGIDMRLNGEFVAGAESWFSLSLMDSKLEIPGRIEEKFPAPYDQTVMVSIFFQDYLPSNPMWRAHINIAYATGIPVISPYNDRYNEFHRLPAYRRADIGITRVIKSADKNSASGFLNSFREVVAGLEIFNLLDINNTISYFWVETINNLSGESRVFAIPNYLTGRSINLKLTATF